MLDPASFDLVAQRRIHIIGAGGAGMSGLAKFLSQLGHRVTGSDLKPSGLLDGLTDSGVETWVGHRPERLADIELVVASTAVPESDPELRAAIDSGLTVWRRPALLDALTAAHPDRLSVEHSLDDTQGFVDVERAERFVGNDLGADFYVCGPGPFMDVVDRALARLQVARDPLFIERFEAPELEGGPEHM